MSTLRTFAGEPLYGRATESAGGNLAGSDGDDVVKLDCYAVMGLSPTAEDAVIRAAYLALMRSYHPDRNPSAEAAARARAITEAYKTIGDPARRAEYDAGRRASQFDILGYDDDEAEPVPRLWRKAPAIPWPSAPVIGTVAASALAIVLAVTVLPSIESGRADTAQPRTTESSIAPGAGNRDPAAIPPRTLDTKPPVEAVEEARPQPAPAAVTPAEHVLAARSGPAPAIAGKTVPAKADPPPQPKRTAQAAAQPAASPRPAPVDEKARLAALEWQSTSFYNQSVNHADDARRLQLQQARDLFVASRNACRSDSCAGDAHVSYMRDISRIMQKPKQADP